MDTKKAVLLALEKNKGTAISGGKLAKDLGCSRTAVWKGIATLKEEGYDIDSLPGRGYLLSSSSDILQEEGILPYLREPVTLHIYETLDSTNKTATLLAMEGAPHGTTVLARQQSQGRGRRGRNFYSPKDTGLYLTMILEPSRWEAPPLTVTAAAAVALCRAVETISPAKPRIKWVNDIFIDNKKVCGILTEALTDMESGGISHMLLGIGVNCFTQEFPPEAGPLAGSIPGDFSKNQLAAEIINQLLELYRQPTSAFMEDYRKRSLILGRNILVYNPIGQPGKQAQALDINEEGGLHVRYPDGTEDVLNTGEITIRLGE